MPTQPSLVLEPGQGKTFAVGGSTLTAKLLSAHTGGQLCLTEYALPPHFPGPPPHQHRTFEHAWYVLEGELSVQLGAEERTLPTGSFVFIPQRTVHAFANRSAAPVRVLVVDTPGGFEHYYEELQHAFGDGRALDPARIRAIQLRYDTFPPDHQFEAV